jgi:predicted N-acetyltransferase YhbS
MLHKFLNKNSQKEVTCLFRTAFTLSAGEKEGRLIGNLASKLSSGIDNEEIICFATYEGESIIGSIFFTHLRFKEAIQVYMLAPVAVRKEHQRKGVGQSLITYGLNEMKNRSIAVAITYGDPSFYSKVGFKPLSENVIQSPHKLLMPEGWQGQSLTGKPIPIIKERPSCVEEFNDPAYW